MSFDNGTTVAYSPRGINRIKDELTRLNGIRDAGESDATIAAIAHLSTPSRIMIIDRPKDNSNNMRNNMNMNNNSNSNN